MEELKKRQDMDPEYTWDLSSLFESDEAWEKAFNELDGTIEGVAELSGKLNTPENVRLCFDRSTLLERKLSDAFTYAFLRRSEDTTDEAAQSMYSRCYGKYVEALTKTAFIDPELLSLPSGKLREISESEELIPYTFMMEKLILQKPFTLSEKEEALLASFGETFAVPSEVSKNLQDADMVFEPAEDSEGKNHEVTNSAFVLLQTSEDRTLRGNAFRSMYKSYKGHIQTFAATYSGEVKTSVSMASARGYSSSRAMHLFSENIPETVYDNLIDSVREHMPAMYRYAELRKRLLGVDELHYYDLYTPLIKGSNREYTYEQAQEMVLEAVKPLGETYVSEVRKAFDSRYIDVYPNKGKAGGAFSSGTYDSNPYILTNFTGTLDSVSTIAHEMGHSMHTHFSNVNQPPQYAEYTLFVAEVASTVNENLLIRNLLSKAETPEEKLFYLNQHLENFKATVYRQTMFAEFEREVHRLAEEGGVLNPSGLNGIYESLVKDYFGPALKLDEEVKYEWARIPHFYRPFYVYKYATSYAAATDISERLLSEGRPAVEKYLEFLSMGGSDYPIEELKVAGVDLTSKDPVDRALERFESLLDEFEETLEEIK